MSPEGRKEERKGPTFTVNCIIADIISHALQLVLEK
jgi:hypothetical protein